MYHKAPKHNFLYGHIIIFLLVDVHYHLHSMIIQVVLFVLSHAPLHALGGEDHLPLAVQVVLLVYPPSTRW
jgi:hypothetical protein